MDTPQLDTSLSHPIALMPTQQARRRIPEFQFRVLIIGRANAGKTSILQRICETTNSPIIYRGNRRVRGPTILSTSLISRPTRFDLARPWMLVAVVLLFWLYLIMGASEASTISTMNWYSPIIGVTFFTIHEESSRVAQRNSRLCNNSFETVV